MRVGAREITRKEQQLTFLKGLADGHLIITKSSALDICEVFSVKLDKNLIEDHDVTGGWRSDETLENSVLGVWDLDLLKHLAKSLDVETSNKYSGRGYEARCLADRIAFSLGLIRKKGDLFSEGKY